MRWLSVTWEKKQHFTILSTVPLANDIRVWNFCAYSSDVISWGNCWWHCKMLAVFFFRTDFQWLLGLKNTCFTLSIWQAAHKFSSPRAAAYFLKHCLRVCWWLSWSLAHCMDKGTLELFFLRSKIFCLSVGWNCFQAVHLFSINKSYGYCTSIVQDQEYYQKLIERFLHTVRNLSFLCKYNAPNTDIYLTGHLKISNCILLIFKPSFWLYKIVCRCLQLYKDNIYSANLNVK